MNRAYIGTAGWSIPKAMAMEFPDTGSHLERYAGKFSAVEINSTFYRKHKPETFERWALSVPEDFRFSVKIPKEITHRLKLTDVEEPLNGFVADISLLGDKLGPLLVQLPPSLNFQIDIAAQFFSLLRLSFSGLVACEPRHPSWFMPEAEQVLVDFQIARVAADPSKIPDAAEPGGWGGLVYYRLHGSPRMYYSSYAKETLDTLAEQIRDLVSNIPVWCMFDNTTLGFAAENTLSLMERLR